MTVKEKILQIIKSMDETELKAVYYLFLGLKAKALLIEDQKK